MEKEGALAMAGVREREASAGMERAEGQAAAKAQAEGGRRCERYRKRELYALRTLAPRLDTRQSTKQRETVVVAP